MYPSQLLRAEHQLGQNVSETRIVCISKADFSAKFLCAIRRSRKTKILVHLLKDSDLYFFN